MFYVSPDLKATFSFVAEVLPLDGSEKRGGSLCTFLHTRFSDFRCMAEKVLYTHF